jgi:hypothetical protein
MIGAEERTSVHKKKIVHEGKYGVCCCYPGVKRHTYPGILPVAEIRTRTLFLRAAKRRETISEGACSHGKRI